MIVIMVKMRNIPKRLSQKALNVLPAELAYNYYCEKAYRSEKSQTGKEYIRLQKTWNRDIIKKLEKYDIGSEKMIGIGAFYGLVEMSYASRFKNITCVDHENYLPKWAPNNINTYITNIDSGQWTMPTDEGMFDLCLFVETVEHLRWSPLPILKWIRKNSHLAVISTPDDKEWPPMPNKPWVQSRHFTKIPKAKPNSKGNPSPMDHCKQYDQVEFIELLDHVGFRVMEMFRTGEGKHQMVAIVTPRV